MKLIQLIDRWVAKYGNPCPDYPRSDWLVTCDAKIYIRRGYYDGRYWLTIANVSVRGSLRGNGMFTKILDHCIKVSPWARVYVECIQNPRLFIHLIEKRGFTSIGGLPPSCYLIKERLNEPKANVSEVQPAGGSGANVPFDHPNDPRSGQSADNTGV